MRHVALFVGSFIANCMTHLWYYEGTLNAEKTILTLDTQGPDFPSGKALAKFKDIITLDGDDRRSLASNRIADDGTIQQFMIAHYTRIS